MIGIFDGGRFFLDTDSSLLYVVIAVLIALSAIFSSAETAATARISPASEQNTAPLSSRSLNVASTTAAGPSST